MQSFNIKDIVINEKTITLPNKKTYPKLTLGNIYAQRDWGYAGDYVHAAFLMLQQDKPDDYVICTGQTRSVLDFLKEAFSYAGIVDIDPLSLVYIDPDLFRPCEVEYLRGCSFKAQHELGWTPTHTFNDLVRMMVDHDKEKL
jgi:GDPmannose 4,6-dehydratase